MQHVDVAHEPGSRVGRIEESFTRRQRRALAAGDDAGDDGTAAPTLSTRHLLHLQYLALAGGAAVRRILKKASGFLVFSDHSFSRDLAAPRAQRGVDAC